MPDSITCGRCGMTSRNPDDIAAVYCGHCHAVAAPYIRPGLPWDDPGADILGDIRASMQHYYDAPVAGETVLTPEVLLTDGRWLFEGFSGDEARFRFSPLAGPWVSSWRPHSSLGAFTADWTRGEAVQLRVRREVIERAAAELAGQVPVHRLMQPSCLALMTVLKAMRPAAPAPGQGPDTWHCERCGRLMQVPPGMELMLCGYHEPAERMAIIQLTDLHASALSMAVQVCGTEFSVLQSRQDELIAAMVLSGPPTLAGLAVDARAELAEEQIRASNEIAASRTRREHHQNLQRVNQARRQRLLGDAEKMIARLDGEGYGVRAKAEQVDRETASTPELPLADPRQGGNAAQWSPGDPTL